MSEVKGDFYSISFEPKNFLQFRENAFARNPIKGKLVFGTLESTEATLESNVQVALKLKKYDEILLGFYLAKSAEDIIRIYNKFFSSFYELADTLLPNIVLKFSSTNFNEEVEAIRRMLDCDDEQKLSKMIKRAYLGNIIDSKIDVSRLQVVRDLLPDAEISVANCSSDYLDKLEDKLDYIIPFTVQPVTNIVASLKDIKNTRIYNSRELYVWGLRRFPAVFRDFFTAKCLKSITYDINDSVIIGSLDGDYVSNTINVVLGSNDPLHIKENSCFLS